MARKQPDFVIEAVHFTPEGVLGWVRGYERRGMAYSSPIVLSRAELVQRLKRGQRVVVGRRKSYLGHTFDIHATLALRTEHGQEAIVSEGGEAEVLLQHRLNVQGAAAKARDRIPAPLV